MASEMYWQCGKCDAVVLGGPQVVHESGHYQGRWCGTTMDRMEPVAVLPLAEAEALRRLLEAVEDDALFGAVAQLPDDEWLEAARVDVVGAYRAALLAAMKGGKP